MLYEELEKEMTDIEKWSKYRDYIYEVIYNMDEESLLIFTVLLYTTDFKPSGWVLDTTDSKLKLSRLGKDGPASAGDDIIINFSALEESATTAIYEEYQERYNMDPWKEAIEDAIRREIQDAFFHEMGHRYDRSPDSWYDRSTATKSDTEAISHLQQDTFNYLYAKLQEEGADEATAEKISRASVRGYTDGGELIPEETALKETVLERIHQEALDDYDNTYMLLEGFSGTMKNPEDRNTVDLRTHSAAYYEAEGAAAMEMYAHFCSLKFQGNEEALAKLEEMYPNLYGYFNEKWETTIYSAVNLGYLEALLWSYDEKIGDKVDAAIDVFTITEEDTYTPYD